MNPLICVFAVTAELCSFGFEIPVLPTSVYMKKVMFCLSVIFMSASSFCVEIPALPPSEYADTEVATNFSFAVGESGGCRLVFSLELQATPTNNVEVAIGHVALIPHRLEGN